MSEGLQPMWITGVFRERVSRLRDRLGPLWWYVGLIFIAQRVNDLIMMYVGAIYLPSRLSSAQLGSIDPLIRLAGFGGIPLTVVSMVGAKYLSAYAAVHAYGKIKCVLRDMACLALLSSIVSVSALFLASGAVAERMQLEGNALFLGVAGLVVFSSWNPILSMMLQGTQRFYATIVSGLAGNAVRLVLVLVLVPFFFLTGYIWAMFLAGVVTIIAGGVGLRPFLSRRLAIETYYEEWKDLLRFALPVLLYVSVTSLQSFMEPFVVRHRLSALDAGAYYVLFRLGSIPAFLVGAISYVLFPHLSQKHESGESTASSYSQALKVTALVCLSGTALMFLFGTRILSLLSAWRPYVECAPFMWRIGLILTINALVTVHVLHEMACRRFNFVRFVAPVGICHVVVLYSVFGWGFFQPYLPAGLWQAVDGIIEPSLALAVGIGLAFRLFLAGLLWLRHMVPGRDG